MGHMEPVFKMLSKEAKKEPLFIESATGRKLKVSMLRKGESYGLDKCLTWNEDEDCVEFYDVTKGEQFVSSYYVRTLLKRDQNCGLCLSGGIHDWDVNADEMGKVYVWLEGA